MRRYSKKLTGLFIALLSVGSVLAQELSIATPPVALPAQVAPSVLPSGSLEGALDPGSAPEAQACEQLPADASVTDGAPGKQGASATGGGLWPGLVGSGGGLAGGLGGGAANAFNPRVGSLPSFASYSATWFPDEQVRGQPTTLGFVRQDLSWSTPIWQNSTNDWSTSFHVRDEHFNTGAILPTSNQPFPGDLWNITGSTTYRHQFDNGWIAGVGGTFGSASDMPFHGLNELTAGGNAFLRVPSGDTNAWLFSLSYSTNSQLNFPLPGVAYLYAPSQSFQASLGLPFSVLWRPVDDLLLQATYVPLTNFSARATYRLMKGVRLYTGYTAENENYFRVGRTDPNDRFFYYDNRASAGTQFVFTQWLLLDFSGGYVFNRYFFEGQTLANANSTNRIDVGAGPFVGLHLQMRY